jgi:hypothetical protein
MQPFLSLVLQNTQHQIGSRCSLDLRSYQFHQLLTFETEKKANLFLKEKIDLVTDLSKAGMI